MRFNVLMVVWFVWLFMFVMDIFCELMEEESDGMMMLRCELIENVNNSSVIEVVWIVVVWGFSCQLSVPRKLNLNNAPNYLWAGTN